MKFSINVHLLQGRTGVMVSCYMLHRKLFPSAEKALSYYGSQRTTDRKVSYVARVFSEVFLKD